MTIGGDRESVFLAVGMKRLARLSRVRTVDCSGKSRTPGVPGIFRKAHPGASGRAANAYDNEKRSLGKERQ